MAFTSTGEIVLQEVGSSVERAELASPVVSALNSTTTVFNPVGKISSSEVRDMGFLHSINMTIY